MRVVHGFAEAKAALTRRPLEDMVLSQEAQERLEALFGERLGPEEAVRRIMHDVRQRGDAALRDFTYRIDGISLGRFEVEPGAMQAALHALDPSLREALTFAAARIEAFHRRQPLGGWVEFHEGGLGQMVVPLERVGVYVPGGTAAYPSTVLMTVIPAKVAGVAEVVAVTPPGKDGAGSSTLLAACALAGVDRLFAVGGAQAIAALAYGTATIPKVDKVVGPGNLFVALAKKQVYGVVGIDGLYGPSETIVIADESANPEYCAADLLAQAEHDVLASPIFITTSAPLAEAVQRELERQLPLLERSAVAGQALERQGVMVVVDDMEEAFALANTYAPEHLCLLLRDPWRWIGRVRHAGGVFVGEEAPEVLGDYTAGPSHAMPTGGTARFGSPLSVADFVKIISLVGTDGRRLRGLAEPAIVIARAEGFTAHARALEVRLQENRPREMS